MEEEESKNSKIEPLDAFDVQMKELQVSKEGFEEEKVVSEKMNSEKEKFNVKLINPDSDLFLEKQELKLRVCLFKELMRRVMLLKYMRIGLYTREFYSTDMKIIFVVLKGQENVIAKRAEVLGMMKELEIGYTDLISLEPVDKLKRPFRFKNSILEKLNKTKIRLGKSFMEGDGDAENQALITNSRNKDFEVIKGFDKYSIKDFIEKIEMMDESEFEDQWKNQIAEQIEVFDEITEILKQRKLVSEYPISMEEEMKRKFKGDYLPDKKEIAHFLVFLNLMTNYNKKIKSDYFDKEGQVINNDIMDIGRLYSGSFLNSLREIRLTYKEHYGEKKCYSCLKKFGKRLKKILGVGTAIDEENGAYIGESRNRKVLPTIWDQFGVNPFGPFIPFTTLEKQLIQFKHEEINELGHQKIFVTKDRIKVVYSLILETSHIFELVSHGIVQEFMPLHDPYVLKGEKKKELFNKIPPFNEDFFEKQEEKLQESQLKMGSSLNPNESQGQTIHNLVKGSTSMLNYKESANFRKEINPLSNILAFRCKAPLTIHHLSVHRYFGAAVSLYFNFLQFFVRKVQFIGFVGAIVFVIDTIMIKGGTTGGVFSLAGYHSTRIIFSMIIIIWTCSFLEYWKRRETMFAARFNGDNLKARKENSKDGRYGSGGKGIDERRRLDFRGICDL